jgi:hypothetical protein
MEKMPFLKLVLVVFATICVLVLFTYAWVVARIPGAKWLSSQNQGSTGIDLYALSAFTLHSPVYWMLAPAILAGAGWLCRHWVFPA